MTAILQSREGFIWLGTEAGLVRFDGNSFQLFDRSSSPALPDNDISCLIETGDGAMWIGTSNGLAQWANEEMRAYSTRDGLPDNNIRALSLDARGGLIVTTEIGAVSIVGGKVVPIKLDKLQSPSAQQNPIFTVQLADGDKAQATASTVTLMQSGKNVSLMVGKGLPGSRIQALIADREGTLWIGTNAGLVALACRAASSSLPVTDPLATASVLALMEDREGNLWVGTESAGLHILRDQRFRILGERDGLSSEATTTVMEDRAGTLWVGTQDAGLNAIEFNGEPRSQVSTWTLRNGLMSDLVLSLAAAPDGDVWVGTPDGLNRIRGNKVDAYTSADGLPDDFIRSLLVDQDGSLWIGTRRGLAHWKNASEAAEKPQFEILTQANGLGSDTVGAMARNTSGDLWIATFGGLSRLHDGKINNLHNGQWAFQQCSHGASAARATARCSWARRITAGIAGTVNNFRRPRAAISSQAAVHAILDDCRRAHLVCNWQRNCTLRFERRGRAEQRRSSCALH